VADNNFSKKFRLLSASDFSHLKTDTLVFKRFNLRVYFKKNVFPNSRIGISVSTKVGNSVLRNRFKRIIRENFRNSQIKICSYDILFVVQSTRPINQEINLIKSINEFYNHLLKNV
jgi:ribonuclease P protein component